MVLPIVKLATLLIKQFTRPVVNSFNERAKQSPRFRKIIVGIAQKYHLMDFTSQSRLFGFGKPIKIKPLTEEDAVNLGSKLIGETLVYGISVALLMYEYNRSSRNEKIKEERQQYKIARLELRINEYGMTTERQDAEIKELRRRMFELEDKNKSLASRILGSLTSSKHNSDV